MGLPRPSRASSSVPVTLTSQMCPGKNGCLLHSLRSRVVCSFASRKAITWISWFCCLPKHFQLCFSGLQEETGRGIPQGGAIYKTGKLRRNVSAYRVTPKSSMQAAPDLLAVRHRTELAPDSGLPSVAAEVEDVTQAAGEALPG